MPPADLENLLWIPIGFGLVIAGSVSLVGIYATLIVLEAAGIAP